MSFSPDTIQRSADIDLDGLEKVFGTKTHDYERYGSQGEEQENLDIALELFDHCKFLEDKLKQKVFTRARQVSTVTDSYQYFRINELEEKLQELERMNSDLEAQVERAKMASSGKVRAINDKKSMYVVIYNSSYVFCDHASSFSC